MAGVDVTASDQSEFFIVGKPLFEVAKAEKGQLLVDKSVYQYTTVEGKGGENTCFASNPLLNLIVNLVSIAYCIENLLSL
jgi:hypothetical protein